MKEFRHLLRGRLRKLLIVQKYDPLDKKKTKIVERRKPRRRDPQSH